MLSSPYPTDRPYASPPSGRRRRPIPDAIQRFFVPLPVLKATSDFMQRFGREERECYVWWGGYFTAEGDGQVVTALCPEIRSSYGHLKLETKDLVVLHSKLRERDQVLLIELHSHPPGAGGQNEVDAGHPAATYVGFITIVVPDFAFPVFHDLRTAYVYEYVGTGRWRELTPEEIGNRFVIEESSLPIRV